MQLFATEVDSFTNRYEPMEDSLGKLDDYINEELDIAVKMANENIDCSKYPEVAEKSIYETLYQVTGGFLWARIENKVTETNYVEARQLSKANSIYRELDWINSFVLNLVELGAVINLDGKIIGSDKLGHFLGIGWKYFQVADLSSEGIIKAMELGHVSEKSFFGEMTTGVYSYADLASNYDGYIFWTDLLNSKKSPSVNPYLVCQKKKLVRVRDFSWSNYVTEAWDEGINCNKFRSKTLERKVENEILKLEKDDPANRYRCPIRSCGSLNRRYPKGLLNC